MGYGEIIRKLRSMRNERNLAGMARYGINTDNTLGISIYVLRDMAKDIGIDHELALQLWKSKIHEARTLASMVDDPALVSEAQMDSWAKDFDSWDVCDQVCTNLFDRTRFAYRKALEWSSREEEFVKRAAFAIVAGLAVHDKSAEDSAFGQFFPAIERAATDDRNYVRKAVSWALRNIGKRNLALNRRAIGVAERLKLTESRAARWIGSDAMRELRGEGVQKRLKK